MIRKLITALVASLVLCLSASTYALTLDMVVPEDAAAMDHISELYNGDAGAFLKDYEEAIKGQEHRASDSDWNPLKNLLGLDEDATSEDIRQALSSLNINTSSDTLDGAAPKSISASNLFMKSPEKVQSAILRFKKDSINKLAQAYLSPEKYQAISAITDSIFDSGPAIDRTVDKRFDAVMTAHATLASDMTQLMQTYKSAIGSSILKSTDITDQFSDFENSWHDASKFNALKSKMNLAVKEAIVKSSLEKNTKFQTALKTLANSSDLNTEDFDKANLLKLKNLVLSSCKKYATFIDKSGQLNADLPSINGDWSGYSPAFVESVVGDYLRIAKDDSTVNVTVSNALMQALKNIKKPSLGTRIIGSVKNLFGRLIRSPTKNSNDDVSSSNSSNLNFAPQEGDGLGPNNAIPQNQP